MPANGKRGVCDKMQELSNHLSVRWGHDSGVYLPQAWLSENAMSVPRGTADQNPNLYFVIRTPDDYHRIFRNIICNPENQADE